MKKKVLIVVDMQEDFVSGSLGTKEAQAIVPRVAEKAAHFDGTVIFTLDTHGADYLKTQEGRILPVPHCIKGTAGHRLVPELENLAERLVIALCRNWRIWRNGLARKKWKRKLLAPLLLLESLKKCGIPSRASNLWAFARISALFPMP